MITYSWSSFSSSPAPVESKTGPKVIPSDLSRAPAELRAKRSFSQVPSGGKIQRSFPPAPTHPKCIWETFKTPLKRKRQSLCALPTALNSQEMWTRVMHEMFPLTLRLTQACPRVQGLALCELQWGWADIAHTAVTWASLFLLPFLFPKAAFSFLQPPGSSSSQNWVLLVIYRMLLGSGVEQLLISWCSWFLGTELQGSFYKSS